MPELAEIVFRGGGKVYSFDPAGIQLSVGDCVIVRTSRGMEMGKVVVANHEVPESEIVSPLEKVIRMATASDEETAGRNEKLAARAAQVCEEKVKEYNLDMRLISTEVVFDGSKIVISFFAEERVDFRKLVEDLAKKFRTRIEFRQVGVRDEARLIGGYGPCGRKMCCTMFAGDQQPVSIKMAKEQNLPLNPMKISGICGRLMCCLKYEQEAYKCFKRQCPAKGTMVDTDRGEGKVVDYSVPKERVMIDLGEGRQVELGLPEISPAGERPRRPEKPREREKQGERPREKQGGRPRGRQAERPSGKPGRQPERQAAPVGEQLGEKAAAESREKQAPGQKPSRSRRRRRR